MVSVTFKPKDFPKTINYLDTNKGFISDFKTTKSPKVIMYNQVLPFRVRYSSIGIPGKTDSIPPIGIAVIGISNYIL